METKKVAEGDLASKKAERLNRLKELHMKRNEARKKNHQELVEEDRRNKLPKNYESIKRRHDWELEDMEKREKAESLGLDYDRVKLLDVQADTADLVEKAKARKKNPDTGWAGFEQMSQRTYDRQSKQLKVDMTSYNEMKNEMGDEFYPTANTLIQSSHYPDRDAIDKMTEDLEKQASKRSRYHRRRTFDPEANVDYINEKNKKYNEKIERFFGKYTEETKQALERGTAV